MKTNVTISVLMAVFNTDFALSKRAIDSVLNQSFQDFELIIIDDGTNNDPLNQLFAYIQQHQHKITYLRHANCGQSRSVNRGILNASGKFITMLDADDEYEPHHLWACLQEMETADLIASTSKTIVDSDEDYFVLDKQDASQMIHVDDCILFATLFGKKEVFVEVPFQSIYAADAAFYELVSQKYMVRKVDLRSYIYYRNSPDSACAMMKREQLV